MQPPARVARKPMRIEARAQQRSLKKHQARNPNCGRPAQDRQQLFRRNGFHQKEEKGAKKNRATK